MSVCLSALSCDLSYLVTQSDRKSSLQVAQAREKTEKGKENIHLFEAREREREKKEMCFLDERSSSSSSSAASSQNTKMEIPIFSNGYFQLLSITLYNTKAGWLVSLERTVNNSLVLSEIERHDRQTDRRSLRLLYPS